MPEVRIEAEPRTEFGKGAARRTRRAGRVPAVMYGHGAENRHMTLPEHELMLALKTPNALIRLEGLEGRAPLALPKAVQRDAIRGVIEHVDLIEVRSGEKVTVQIPIRVTGDVAPGAVDAVADDPQVKAAFGLIDSIGAGLRKGFDDHRRRGLQGDRLCVRCTAQEGANSQ